jgi:HD-GYP domain-containing protein (c-di-GMP phosphodiesterase class II)
VFSVNLGSESLSIALDERDHSTQEHCDRVLGLCRELGKECGLSEPELRVLSLAAALHDIGKIGIPDTVLKKPGKFDEADWAIMKTHSVRSARIVLATNVEGAEEISLIVRHHHERFDGQGYPDGLSGEAIPAMARLVAVADTYDAMGRMRMRGAPLPHVEIMAELHRVSGQQHDPYCLSKFAAMIDRSEFRVA